MCKFIYLAGTNQQVMDGGLKTKDRFSQNSLHLKEGAVMMYLDMNSFFASCEQQDNPQLRGKPIGVITHPSGNACVIAPSIEAKKYGVKTGMRLMDCRVLCPQIVPVLCRPHRYRHYHVLIMDILGKYCDDVLPKSIDEAVMNFSSYRRVYSDFKEVAKLIKAEMRQKCGEYVKCSIGIAPNAYLAKVATEIQKPDGLIEITPENIDEHLSKLKLTDLPGIAKANERRLNIMGIYNPVALRECSEMWLRKAFGGVVGDHWYNRLHFKEVDMYKNNYRGMSAGRTLSRQQREDSQAMESMLVSLCNRLEQRLMKQDVCCKEVNFSIKYYDGTYWDTKIKLALPLQDGVEMRRYIQQRIQEFEGQRKNTYLLNSKVQHMLVSIAGFMSAQHIQYTLFDNRIRQDKARKIMYAIKDDYGKNSVRRAAEIIQHDVMRDAIGFGSVKDLYQGTNFNHYLMETDGLGPKQNRTTKAKAPDDPIDWEVNQDIEQLTEHIEKVKEKEHAPDRREVKKTVVHKIAAYYDGWE